MQILLLMPSIFMQALGQPCYKRVGLKLAKTYFKKDEWEVIDIASSARFNNAYGISKPPDFLVTIFNIMKSPWWTPRWAFHSMKLPQKELMNIVNKRTIYKAFKLSETMFDILCNEI